MTTLSIHPEDLDALLSCFGRTDARVLEYWFDNSLRSDWRKPECRYTPYSEVIRSDLIWYGRCGFSEAASFACYLGPEYERHWGEPDISDFRPTHDVVFRSFHGENGGRDHTTFRCWLDGSLVRFRFDVWDDTVCAAHTVVRKRELEDYDRVEVFFSSDANLAKDVCCIEMDPFGRVLDYKMRSGFPFDYSWRSKTIKVMAEVVHGGYVVKGTVAAAELAEQGIDISDFHIGAFRADYAASGRLIDWYSSRRPNGRHAKFHQPNMLSPAGFGASTRRLSEDCASDRSDADEFAN